MCVCLCVCVFYLFTPFLSSLIASNQQIYDLRTRNVWKEKTLWKVNFSYQRIIHLIISCKGSSCEHIRGCVNLYLYECVSLLAHECAVCVCVYVCVISNQSTSKKPHTYQTSVNLTPFCIKHRSRTLWY